MLIAVLLLLGSASRQTDASNPLAGADVAALRVIVEPGNTEIQRGTSLAITARFTDAEFEDAKLIVQANDGMERKMAMRQNLSDPVVGGFIASVDEEFTYRIESGDWTSESYQVDVFDFPSLVRSDAGLDYPQYTKLEDKIVEDTVRVSAVEGTQVTWRCFLNKPVASCTLVGKDGQRVEMQPDSEYPGALSSNFDLQKTTRFTLELLDSDGRKNKYPPELVAKVLPNHPPKLKLANARDTSVSPLEELPLGVEVRDDFGVEQVGLSYTFASKDVTDVVLGTNIQRGSKHRIQHLIALEELDAKPDQLLSYHFWAEDVGPDGQPRRTQSDMFFADVRPFEEIFREGEPPPSGPPSQPSPKAQEAEKLAELQKEIINATWTVIRDERGESVSDQFQANVLLLAESQADAISQLSEMTAELNDEQSQAFAATVAKAMESAHSMLKAAHQAQTSKILPQAMTFEQAAYAGLLKLRAREFQITRQQQKQNQSQAGASQKRRQKQLDDLELDQEENRYETQQQAQADSAQEQEQRENRQVLSRLKELARRQEDLNKQLAELQSALEQAETEEERKEVEQQLKRLRDQQQDLLRETDELSERMNSPENAETMGEESEKLDQNRENVRKATEALEQNDASKALTAGKRAEREFEEMRDEFRQRAAGEFDQRVRDMRSAAQELSDAQEQIGKEMAETQPSKASPGLRSEDEPSDMEDSIRGQREKLSELMEQMQQTVQEAEDAEPLLAQKLYDSFRKTQQRQVDQKLSDTSELLKRGFAEEARKSEEPAREGIEQLKEDLESAAKSVLGDETEALRRALGELDQLSQDLDREIQESDPSAQTNRGVQADRGKNPPGKTTGQEPQNGEQKDRLKGQEKPGQGESKSKSYQEAKAEESARDPSSGKPSDQPGQGSEQSPKQEQSPGQGQSPGPGRGSEQPRRSDQDGQPRSGQPSQRGVLNRFAADRPQDAPGSSPSAQPLTGDGFREWSDRLRDVEEMVGNLELRSRAARIRDRAKEVRVEVKRNSKNPQWRLVEEMIAVPLRELRRDMQEELLRQSAEKNALVPIDRDPVPSEFTEAVQKYYESLGSGR